MGVETGQQMLIDTFAYAYALYNKDRFGNKNTPSRAFAPCA